MSNDSNKDKKQYGEDEVQKVGTEGVPKNPFNDNDSTSGNTTTTTEEDAAAEQQRKEAMTERD